MLPVMIDGGGGGGRPPSCDGRYLAALTSTSRPFFFLLQGRQQSRRVAVLLEWLCSRKLTVVVAVSVQGLNPVPAPATATATASPPSGLARAPPSTHRISNTTDSSEKFANIDRIANRRQTDYRQQPPPHFTTTPTHSKTDPRKVAGNDERNLVSFSALLLECEVLKD